MKAPLFPRDTCRSRRSNHSSHASSPPSTFCFGALPREPARSIQYSLHSPYIHGVRVPEHRCPTVQFVHSGVLKECMRQSPLEAVPAAGADSGPKRELLHLKNCAVVARRLKKGCTSACVAMAGSLAPGGVFSERATWWPDRCRPLDDGEEVDRE